MEVYIEQVDQNQINFMNFSNLDVHTWDLDYLNACVYYHQLIDSVKFQENTLSVEELSSNVTDLYTDVLVQMNSLVDVTESPIKFLGEEVVRLVHNNFVTNPYSNNGNPFYLKNTASPEFKGFLSGAYGEAIVQYLFNKFKTNDDYSIAKIERVPKVKTPDFVIFKTNDNSPYSIWEAKGTVSHLPSSVILRREKANPEKQIQKLLNHLRSKGFQFLTSGVFSKVHVPLTARNKLRTRIVDPELTYSFDLPNLILRNYMLKNIYEDVPPDVFKDRYIYLKTQCENKQEILIGKQKKLYDKYSFLINNKSINNKDYTYYLEEIISSTEYKKLIESQEEYIESLLPIIEEDTLGDFFTKINKLEESTIEKIAWNLKDNRR